MCDLLTVGTKSLLAAVHISNVPTQAAPSYEHLLTVGTRLFLFLVDKFDVFAQVAPRCELLPTVRTRLFLFLVDKFDVVVQARSFNLLLTMWALRPLVAVHLSDVPTQVAFRCNLLLTSGTNTMSLLFLVDILDVVVQARSFKLPLTVWALLPLALVHHSDMPTQAAPMCELLLTVGASLFHFLVDPVDVFAQVAPRCELLLTVGTRHLPFFCGPC